MHSTSRFFTVHQWTEQHPWPPLGGLRHLIFHAKSNGFDAVIRRVGRRVLIDEAAFFAWVEGQGKNEEPESATRRRLSSRSA